MRAQRLTGGVVAIGILMMLTGAACRSETQNPPPASDALAPDAPGSTATDIPTGSAGVTALMDKLSNVQPPAQGSRAAALVREAVKPIAESPMIEEAPAPATGERPLERVGAETFDATRLFPPVTAQVPKVWIGWYVNRTIDAFRQAIDENKPLVLVVSEDWCIYCENLARNALRCAAVDRFAGDAVFVYSSPSKELGTKSIAGSLKINAYPTITVLEPESRLLLERGRINGYYEASVLGGHFDTLLWKTAPRILPDDFDAAAAEQRDPRPGPPRAPWAPPPGGPATYLSALFGAFNRGLTHAAPAPKCE